MPYLKGLNSLRFFAALLVLLCHAQMNLGALNIKHAEWPILYLGTDSVHFFFVLSGFLLTYLALTEFEGTGTINIRRFFFKRILRIWPLYYLCVALGFIVLGLIVPYIQGKPYLTFSVGQGLPYYLFFLPNYMAALTMDGSGALFALWSIGVEEQFYLFFPFLMLFIFKLKRPVLLIAVISITYTIFYYAQYYGFIKLPAVTGAFINTLKFHFMFFGCMGAILYKKKPAFIHAILPGKKNTQAVLLLLLCVIIFVPLNINYGLYSVLSGLLYVCFIINTFSAPVQIINFERPWLSYLGTISYGIYMYHPYLSYLLRYAVLKIGWLNTVITMTPVLYYVALLLLTICVAHLSYRYFESRFLRMKKKA